MQLRRHKSQCSVICNTIEMETKPQNGHRPLLDLLFRIEIPFIWQLAFVVHEPGLQRSTVGLLKFGFAMKKNQITVLRAAVNSNRTSCH